MDPVSCGTMVVLIKRAQSQAKKKTREEKCIQKLFLLLDGIRFIQEVKEGPDDPPILWINANKYIYVLETIFASVQLFCLSVSS